MTPHWTAWPLTYSALDIGVAGYSLISRDKTVSLEPSMLILLDNRTCASLKMWCQWWRCPEMLLSNLVIISISKLWSNFFPGGARSLFFLHKEEVWVCGESKGGGILQVMAKYLQQNYVRNSSFWLQPQQLLSSNRMCFCTKTMLQNTAQCSCIST